MCLGTISGTIKRCRTNPDKERDCCMITVYLFIYYQYHLFFSTRKYHFLCVVTTQSLGHKGPAFEYDFKDAPRVNCSTDAVLKFLQVCFVSISTTAFLALGVPGGAETTIQLFTDCQRWKLTMCRFSRCVCIYFVLQRSYPQRFLS